MKNKNNVIHDLERHFMQIKIILHKNKLGSHFQKASLLFTKFLIFCTSKFYSFSPQVQDSNRTPTILSLVIEFAICLIKSYQVYRPNLCNGFSPMISLGNWVFRILRMHYIVYQTMCFLLINNYLVVSNWNDQVSYP